eukprot:1078910-Pelagomonas_calceolata.AAC.2
MGIWRVSGSARLKNLAMRSIHVFNSTLSGNKLVDVHGSMGMKLARSFNGILLVKSKSFELITGVFNLTGHANTQKDSMKSHSFCTNEFAEVSAYNLKQAKSAALASVKKEQETLHTRLIEVEAKINAAKAEYVRLLQQQLDSLSSRFPSYLKSNNSRYFVTSLSARQCLHLSMATMDGLVSNMVP